MPSKYEIPPNVYQFLGECSDIYARFKHEEFEQFAYYTISELASPIEQLFFIGFSLVCEANFAHMSTVADNPMRVGNDDVLVTPQFKLDKYLIDFAICRHPVDRMVCVELDGHEFHDRDEKQRRYEKRRDRLISSKGFTLLHFTGAEVCADPCAAALEVFRIVSAYPGAAHPKDVEVA